MNARNRKRTFYWANILAPFYLVAFAFAKSWVEISFYSSSQCFSYFQLIHDALWFISMMLVMVLILNLVLKKEISELLWVFYLVTLAAAPLAWAMASSSLMRREYLAEGFFLAVSLGGTAFYYSRNLFKSLMVSAFCLSFIVLALVMVAWLMPRLEGGTALRIASAFGPRPFRAFLFMPVAALALLLFLWRARLFQKDKAQWLTSALAGLGAWGGYFIVAWTSGWFLTLWDCLMSGMPLAGLAALAARVYLWRKGKPGSVLALACLAGMLILQALVVVPLFTVPWDRLEPGHAEQWVHTFQPRDEHRLLKEEPFSFQKDMDMGFMPEDTDTESAEDLTQKLWDPRF